MDLETAKARRDYRFVLNALDEGSAVLGDLRNGVMTYLTERSEPFIAAAMLEIGYLDIELNIYSEAQVTTLPEKKDDLSPVLDYFVCVKDEHGDWVNDGYLEHPVAVDWNAEDWKEQLEQDMFGALDIYAKEKGYSYDGPNEPAGVLAELELHQQMEDGRLEY